jgi:hypothetical protein
MLEKLTNIVVENDETTPVGGGGAGREGSGLSQLESRNFAAAFQFANAEEELANLAALNENVDR